MKYHEDFDLEGLAKGNPQSLLPLYNHLFTNYNSTFTEEVLNVVGDVLSAKSDVRFMESVYKILRDMLNFKPSMTKEQFFTLNNFAERKIIMCIEIMRIVRERCRFLGPKNPTNPHIKVSSVVDCGLHTKKEDGKGEPIPCEDVKSVSSQRLKSEANTEASSETALQRKLSDKVCRPAHSLMGISEKEGWHVKMGYLRPKSPEEESVLSKKDEVRKRSLSREKNRSGSRDKSHHHSPTLHRKAGKRCNDLKMLDGSSGGLDVPSDWDPSEAVECILSKVRDLPNQLTSFMKAVESRLLKIEDRLDYMEALVTGINFAEGKASCGDLKREVDLLQARITLLENRVTLAESKESQTFGDA